MNKGLLEFVILRKYFLLNLLNVKFNVKASKTRDTVELLLIHGALINIATENNKHERIIKS